MDREEVEKQMYSSKIRIQNLISQKRLDHAQKMINDYDEIYKNDPDSFCLKAVLEINKGDFDKAGFFVQKGLSIESSNINLLYNMGYIHENKGQYNAALNYFYYALDFCEGKINRKIKNHIEKIEKDYKPLIHFGRKKLIFLVRRQMDHFLDDIIYSLSDEYETRKCVISQYEQIDQAMKWADICWFEWCDELLEYGCKRKEAQAKKIICRIHRREVFSDYPKRIMWEKVDKLIIITGHLLKLLELKVPAVSKLVNIATIHNGVNLSQHPYSLREKGFNLAYVCNLDARKNPVMMLQIIKKLVLIDKRYRLFIAGKFNDQLIKMYFDYQVKAMNLEDHVIFQGWQNNIADWLKDKNYLVSTSIHESFGYGIAKAMAMGIKPVIHDYLYSTETWDQKYLFNSIDEAVKMITDKTYDSSEYHNFIADNYSLQRQVDLTKKAVKNLIC